MSNNIFLGAINKLNNKYTPLTNATKDCEYKCPDCTKDLILCHGNIVKPYFRHKIDDNNLCTYYNSPNESQIHKDAKLLMKSILEKRKDFVIARKCNTCKKNKNFKIESISNKSTIKIEYRLKCTGIADVAYLDDDQEIVCLFEIFHTHKTLEKNRSGLWFEINATKLIKNHTDILCERNVMCKKCENKINTTNMPMEQLANEIGYGGYYFYNKCLYEIKMAMCKTLQPYFFYVLEDFKNANHNNIYGIEFLKRQQCLVCEIYCNTTKIKPYCFDCYKQIKNDKNSIYENSKKLFDWEKQLKYKNISFEKIKTLRHKYSFLSYVEEWECTNIQEQCEHCNENLLDSNGYPKHDIIWWFGENKKICPHCIKNYVQ